MTYDKPKAYDNARGVYTGFFEGLTPCNVQPADNFTYGRRPDGHATQTPYLEGEYLFHGAVGTNNVQDVGTPSVFVRFPLRRFIHTLLGKNKDVYFGGETLILEMVWSSISKILFKNTDDDNPSVGQVPLGNVSGVISDLELNLCYDANVETQNLVRNQVASGNFKMVVPWVEYENTPIQAGSNHQIQVNYTGAQGKVLSKIYSVPFNMDETANHVYDHSNYRTAVNGNIVNEKVQSYNSKLDVKQLQQSELSCHTFEDYFFNKERLIGSYILSSDEYYAKYVILDNFTRKRKRSDDDTFAETDEDDLIDGFLLLM